jgi:hypothetical protein
VAIFAFSRRAAASGHLGVQLLLTAFFLTALLPHGVTLTVDPASGLGAFCYPGLSRDAVAPGASTPDRMPADHAVCAHAGRTGSVAAPVPPRLRMGGQLLAAAGRAAQPRETSAHAAFLRPPVRGPPGA